VIRRRADRSPRDAQGTEPAALEPVRVRVHVRLDTDDESGVGREVGSPVGSVGGCQIEDLDASETPLLDRSDGAGLQYISPVEYAQTTAESLTSTSE
jgi:hypothetical protein